MCLFGVLGESGEGRRGVDDIGEESWAEIEGEMVYFFLEAAANEVHEPADHIMLNEGRDDSIFNRAFLKQGQTEALNDGSVILLF